MRPIGLAHSLITREHTYSPKKFGLYCTVHDHEKVRRSFFKFVCKRQFYYPLFYDRDTDTHHRRLSRKFTTYTYGNAWVNGYPTFRTWRSQVYEVWRAQFDQHRERWIEEDKAAIANERTAWERERLHKSKKAAEVFRILAAPATFAK